MVSLPGAHLRSDLAQYNRSSASPLRNPLWLLENEFGSTETDLHDAGRAGSHLDLSNTSSGEPLGRIPLPQRSVMGPGMLLVGTTRLPPSNTSKALRVPGHILRYGNKSNNVNKDRGSGRRNAPRCQAHDEQRVSRAHSTTPQRDIKSGRVGIQEREGQNFSGNVLGGYLHQTPSLPNQS